MSSDFPSAPPGGEAGIPIANEPNVNTFLRDHQATEDFKKLFADQPKPTEPDVQPKNATTIQAPKPVFGQSSNRDDLEEIAKNGTAGKAIPLRERCTKEQTANKEKRAKPKSNKFRTLARMIKTNLQWTRDMQEKVTDEAADQDAFVVNVTSRNQTGAETLTFDASHYKVKDRSYGGLTVSSKKILLKHPLERTEEELVVLRDVVDRLKCFMKYPPKVKHDMARVIFYEHFDDGRIIIQQGHVGQSFYFIVSGKVEVTTTKVDRKTGQKQMQVLGELTEGSTFGELALLHNIKRTATIVCKGSSEFLRVDKHDFEAVLRSCYEREWNDRLQALGWLEAFKNFTKLELAGFNNLCSLKEYPRDKIVYGNTDAISDNIYFVISGECLIVREIRLMKEILSRERAKYHLPADTELDDLKETKDANGRRTAASRFSVPETRYWTIGVMTKGFYFGVGEDMRDTYIISKTRVELLEVPRVQFKPGRARLLEKMKDELQATLPANDVLYKRYYEECIWDEYKKKLTSEILTNNAIPNNTKLADVPLAIRNYKGYSLTDKVNGRKCRLTPCKQ